MVTSMGEAMLTRVQKASDRLRETRAHAEARARQIVKDQIAEAVALRDAEVLEAYALLLGDRDGLTGAAIKRAMGTKDHRTYADIVARFDPSASPTFRPAGDQFTRDGDIVTIHYWVHDGHTWTEPGTAEWTDARRPGDTGKVRLLPGTDPEFEDYVISDIERVRALQREIQNAVGR